MRQLGKGKTIAIVMTVMVLGFGTYAFAGWGGQGCQGRGRQQSMGIGNEGCPFGYDAGPSYSTEEQRQQAEAEIQAFSNASKEIRRQLYEKELILRAELVKKETDVKVATGLQKEISDLQAQLDQKWLEHTIKMKTIAPDAGFGFGGGCMAGKGKGGFGFGGGCMAGKGKGGSGQGCGW